MSVDANVARSTLRVGVPFEPFWHPVPGGTGRAAREILLELAQLGSIHVEGVAGWHRPSERRAVDELGPCTFLPMPRPVLYESWLRVRRPRLEHHLGPLDVVWANAMVVPPTRAPVVATVHDVHFLDEPELHSRRGRAFFPRVWEGVLDRATLIVCPSEAAARDCMRHGAAPERTEVVPLGVSSPLSAPESAGFVRRRFNLPHRFALWVGTVEPRKNVGVLIEAIRQVPDLPLVMVGPDGWGVDTRAMLAPLGDRLHRIGPVSDIQLSGLYRAASVFVLPSLVEGFGLPVLEAMAHGTPVVTSADTATAEVAGDAARLVDARDPESVASAVRATFDDPGHTSDLVARGRRRAGQFRWADTAARYAALFERVATAA
ncbi:MAG: glycosyltransferase family 1 protein [Actinomycetota bacterium]